MKNIVSRILSFISWENKEQFKEDLLNNFTILPESIRYAMQYKKAQLGKEEIHSLLHPSFGACGLYIIMKYYDHNPSIQVSILSLMIQHYHDKSILYKKLSLLHLKQQSSHTIVGDKISTLSKYNFNGLDNKFDDITKQINTNQQKPIILLYAGLFGLPSLLESYQGDHIRLFNPKNPSISFVLKKNGEQWHVYQAHIHDISDKYVFIDDMYYTGKAYDQALQSLASLGYGHTLDIYTAVTYQNQ